MIVGALNLSGCGFETVSHFNSVSPFAIMFKHEEFSCRPWGLGWQSQDAVPGSQKGQHQDMEQL